MTAKAKRFEVVIDGVRTHPCGRYATHDEAEAAAIRLRLFGLAARVVDPDALPLAQS